ncbi:MAG: peptide-methionine (S)-S-oxide reductase MsrA [Flavobacteriales bacterium]|nr:peptide-methionine (S)-S-oxide reductase MsrA [Flavobacteriales bacterium]
MKKATFGSGCFWCVEAIYQQLKGVKTVLPGYSGGAVKNPTYEEVCTGGTKHAEVIHLEYDENEISFQELLEIFFKTHDPTTLNRQGEDIGTQYRSVIFPHSKEQQIIAEKTIKLLEHENVFNRPIITSIEAFEVFYEAEDYHKNYFSNNPEKAYCSAVVRPKVEKFKRVFNERLKSS